MSGEQACDNFPGNGIARYLEKQGGSEVRSVKLEQCLFTAILE